MRGTPDTGKPRPTIEDPADPRIDRPRPYPLTLEALRAINRPGATDPRLRPADRWLERWAATRGTAEVLPLAANVTLVPRSMASAAPLDDRESILVDAAIRVSPLWARTFVILWYRSGSTVQEIADFLRIKRRQAVYEERHIVLAYFMGRFAEIGLPVTFLVEAG